MDLGSQRRVIGPSMVGVDRGRLQDPTDRSRTSRMVTHAESMRIADVDPPIPTVVFDEKPMALMETETLSASLDRAVLPTRITATTMMADLLITR